MRRGLSSTVVAAVLTSLAAVVLLMWGAGSGSPIISSPQGTWGPPPLTPPPQAPVTAEPELEPAPEQAAPESRGLDLGDLAILLIVAGVALVLLLVLKAVLNRQRDPREPAEDLEPDELAVLLGASDEDARYRALSERDPRNAVVACWVALEDAVHRSGLARDRAETASELTARVLSRWQVDDQAVLDLSAAYREARFSRHPVTEEQRRRAVDALERIHVDLRRRVNAEREAAEQAAARRGAQSEEAPQ